MKKIVNSTALLGITFVLIFSLFLSTFSTVLFEKRALAAAPADIKDQLSTFMALYLMSDHGDNTSSVCSYKQSISYKDAGSNDIGYDTGSEHQVGYSINGSHQDWGCQDILGSKSGIAALWENATGFKDNQLSYLEKIGYKCSAKEGMCKYPTYENTSNEGFVDAKRSDLLDKLIPLLQGGNPDLMAGITASKNGGKYTITPSNSLKYYAWITAFTTSKDQGGCGAKFVSNYEKGTETQRQLAMSGNNGQENGFYVINAVLPDGSLGQGIYQGEGPGHIASVIDGVGTKNGGKADCHEIADALFESKTSKDNGWTDKPNFSNSNGSWAKAFNKLIESKVPGTQDVTTNTSSGSVDNGKYNECFINIPVIGWLMCGMLNIADDMYTWIKGVVGDLLLMKGANTLSLSADGNSGSNSENGIYKGWVAVKNLSSVLILLVGLFMILSQIFSFEFMSAYTVKKVLPRLIIAAIAIQLSWEIMIILIYLVNAIGAGVYELLVSPFSSIVHATRGPDHLMSLNELLGEGGTNIGDVGIFAFVIGLGSAGLVAGGFIGMAIAAIGVIITCFIVYFTLIVRYILILVLLMLSPVALVMWVLPGTQSIWKNWWSNFSKLLFMYPLIMVLFAAGTIGAYVIVNSGLALAQFAAIVAYFGPLFLIPATFKYAGSAMAAAGGGISKLGDKAKNSKRMTRGKEMYQKNKEASRAYNSQQKGLKNMQSDSSFRKMRGRYQTGVYGSKGAYADKANTQLEKGAIDSDYEVLSHSLSSISDRDEQLATAKAQAANTNGTRSSRIAATKWLAANKASDQLAELHNDIVQNEAGGASLWASMQNQSYPEMKAMNTSLVNGFKKDPSDPEGKRYLTDSAGKLVKNYDTAGMNASTLLTQDPKAVQEIVAEEMALRASGGKGNLDNTVIAQALSEMNPSELTSKKAMELKKLGGSAPGPTINVRVV